MAKKRTRKKAVRRPSTQGDIAIAGGKYSVKPPKERTRQADPEKLGKQGLTLNQFAFNLLVENEEHHLTDDQLIDIIRQEFADASKALPYINRHGVKLLISLRVAYHKSKLGTEPTIASFRYNSKGNPSNGGSVNSNLSVAKQAEVAKRRLGKPDPRYK